MCAPPAFYDVPHHSVWHRQTKLKVAACIYVCGVRFYVRRDGLLLNFKIVGEIGVAVRIFNLGAYNLPTYDFILERLN